MRWMDDRGDKSSLETMTICSNTAKRPNAARSTFERIFAARRLGNKIGAWEEPDDDSSFLYSLKLNWRALSVKGHSHGRAWSPWQLMLKTILKPLRSSTKKSRGKQYWSSKRDHCGTHLDYGPNLSLLPSPIIALDSIKIPKQEPMPDQWSNECFQSLSRLGWILRVLETPTFLLWELLTCKDISGNI